VAVDKREMSAELVADPVSDDAVERLIARALAIRASVVLALTVIDCDAPDRQILLGVRAPATNRTHPGVVSTPTQRLEWPHLRPLCSGVDISSTSSDAVTFDLNQSPTGLLLRYAVDALLARKLEVGAALERRRLRYEASIVSLTLGEALYPNLPLTQALEQILMLNVLVGVWRGADLFPRRSASYDPIAWVSAERFTQAVRSKDVFLLFPDGNPLELCIYGMCVATSSSALESDRLGPLVAAWRGEQSVRASPAIGPDYVWCD
jgi:hypothetical protein